MRTHSLRARRTLATGAVLAAGGLAVLILPEAALADVDVPLLPDIPTPSLPSPADLVRSVVDALFELLFGDIPKRITGDVLHWLLTHPDFGSSGRFDTLERGAESMREVAYGLAVAFYCAGLVRHLFDDAATGALEATRRFVFAIAGITVWPWAFELAVRFSNLATEAFLEVPELSRTTIALLSFAFLAGAATGISFICGLLAAILLIALFLEKVLVLTGLTVLYVLMPVLMAASPFPPTSHLVGVGAASLTALLVINPVWTALLAVFALVGEGALLVGAAAVEDFIEPLLAIAMLLLVVGSLPLLLRMAWVRGVAAALMTPATGTHHGGGSALGSAATLLHGGHAVRSVLEQRSSAQLQQSAWHVDDFVASSGGATAAMPAMPTVGGSLGGAGGAGGVGQGGHEATHALDEPRTGRPFEPAAVSQDGPVTPDLPRLAQGPPAQARLFPVDQMPAVPKARIGEPPPADQLHLPLDEPPPR